MGYSPQFSPNAQLLDEEAAAVLTHNMLEAVRLSPANDVHDAIWLSPEDISEQLSVAGADRTIHIEYVLIAAMLLASVGAGLYRLLM